jgi:N-acetylglucosaminyldiphosphoundecaprenol N-acetyl-beta-D-mannosaminyltransferase
MSGTNGAEQAKRPIAPILGVPFSTLAFGDIISLILAWMEGGTPRQVVTANPEIVMRAREDERLWTILQQADLITPDGIGAVYASRLMGYPMEGRVTGADVLPHLLDRANQKGWTVYILGASSESFRRALVNLTGLYSDVSFQGRDGYFKEEELPGILAEIRAYSPCLLLVGLGMGKQETFIADHMHDLRVPVSIGIGGMIDVYAGTVKRAPLFWRRMHLEWLYRLLKQPSRWRRQLVLPKFALAVLKDRFFFKNRQEM